MKSFRPARIAEVIREVAAETILFRLQDPRVRNVTVTRVEVPSDLLTAKVYVSVMGSDQEAKQTLEGLDSSAGYIQRQLADRLKLRYTPTLSFHLDMGLKNSQEVTRLLQQEGRHPDQAELTQDGSESAAAGHHESASSPHADRLAREQES
jgi:ribosome-binding factor A